MGLSTIPARRSFSGWLTAALVTIAVASFVAQEVANANGVRLTWALCALAVAGFGFIGYRRSRPSVLRSNDLPVKIGEPFRGHIEIDIDPTPNDGFWLVLCCTRREPGYDFQRVVTLWQDERTVEPAATSKTPTGILVPFSFDMPTTGEQTADLVKWELTITARGYAARFAVPVIRSVSEPQVPEDRLRPFADVRESLRH